MFRKTLIVGERSRRSAATAASAAVSADEAKQLGTTLTPVGAEKAANKEGTIPEWTRRADHVTGDLPERQRHPARVLPG